MIGYVDASVLLSLILQDKHASIVATWWHQCEDRSSSILLEAECRVVVRRVGALQKNAKKWLSEKESLLDRALEEIQLRVVDAEIIHIIRAEPRLSHCRTLDAIHVATALHFQSHAERHDFRLCSVDRRMNAVAKSAGLQVMADA